MSEDVKQWELEYTVIQTRIQHNWPLFRKSEDMDFSPTFSAYSRSLGSIEPLTFVKREHVHECLWQQTMGCVELQPCTGIYTAMKCMCYEEAHEPTQVNPTSMMLSPASKPKKGPFNKMPPWQGIKQTVRNLGIHTYFTKVLKAPQK